MLLTRAGKRESRRIEGEGRKGDKGGAVVKKDFPAIYLHLRAINNSRASARECALKKIVSARRAQLGSLFRRPLPAISLKDLCVR